MDDIEHDLRIAWYQLQLDGSRPGLESETAARIAREKARVAVEMQGLGIEVPPSLDEAESGILR